MPRKSGFALGLQPGPAARRELTTYEMNAESNKIASKAWTVMDQSSGLNRAQVLVEHRVEGGVVDLQAKLRGTGFGKPGKRLPTHSLRPRSQPLSLLPQAFSNGLLDPAAVRRIGFGAATSTPSLITRTKAEVAGTLLTARLALAHGLACNTAGGGCLPLRSFVHCLLDYVAAAGARKVYSAACVSD